MKYYVILLSLVCMAVMSCEKIQPVAAENYLDKFEFHGPNAVPNVSITMEDVERHIVGYGWESVAIYEIDHKKNVEAEIEIRDELPIGGGGSTLRSQFEVKGFGDDQLIQYGLVEGRYQKLSFSFDERNSTIALSACWYIGHNGKLAYLTNDTMVCVSSMMSDIHMVVFRKVSQSKVKRWREQCPKPGLWI